ncbi:FxsA family protein [Paenibacillus sp. PR3]|uniref:FxsA family protein n=1 Tax=Paenibacillus terricola TaxID=2763503 RepID=A0ABR8MNW5_9BACL|nr:FxsA family protein [Paenibacillus terricola]MBD3917696.1 FxsA family protein [Paenibacillus terricola]
MRKWLLIVIVGLLLDWWTISAVGAWLGGGVSFLLLLLSAFAGFYLMRFEGRKSWLEMQQQLQQGRPPGHAMLDGVCVLLGSILLMLPGFLSDIIGLTLLLPFTRPLYKGYMLTFIERKLRNGGSFTIRRW